MPLSTINSNSFSSTANTNIDNGALFIDAVNGRVGAGTTAPISQFHAKGAGSGTFAPYNDPLVVEGSDYTYLHLKSTNNQAAVLYNRGGSTGWFHGLDNSGNFKTAYMSAINGTALGNAKDGTAAMLIDSSSRVTTPSQPSFHAVRNAGNFSSTGIFICNAVTFNDGSHYNSTTGRFTAPVAGRYQTNFFWLMQGGNNLDFIIRVNGTQYPGIDIRNNSALSSGNFTQGFSAVLKLSASDIVDPYVAYYGSGPIYGQGLNGFSMHFLG